MSKQINAHALMARASSALYLLALLLTLLFLAGFMAAVAFSPVGNWLDSSGRGRALLLGFLWINVPLVALSLTLGLVARCPACRAAYLEVLVVHPVVKDTVELREGLARVRSHVRVATGRPHVCRKCGAGWGRFNAR